ncbi:hypothetical protein ACPA9J_02095 [Pseudomonas aeruginosa]
MAPSAGRRRVPGNPGDPVRNACCSPQLPCFTPWSTTAWRRATDLLQAGKLNSMDPTEQHQRQRRLLQLYTGRRIDLRRGRLRRRDYQATDALG